jgi:adenylyltransferase and sulfurtransferase
MSYTPDDVTALQLQIQGLEAQLKDLKRQLAETDVDQPVNKPSTVVATHAESSPERPTASKREGHWSWPLDADEYRRYGRQMIMPEIGLEGSLSPFQSRDER